MGVIGSVVEDAAKIVQAAVMKYGHVDILINNAGFLRDKSFVKMDKATWDVILDVHLQGTYNMTQAIWPYFSKQGSGKIVNTTSTSGLYGVFGQANYSAAVSRMPVSGDTCLAYSPPCLILSPFPGP